MQQKQFTIEKGIIEIASLRRHPLAEAMGFLRPDELYCDDLREFGALKAPVITEDLYCLTLPDYVEAAQSIGLVTTHVWIIKGATKKDLLKLINFELRFSYRASKTVLYKSVKTLQEFFWNNEEGKQWRNTIGGADINDVIGKLVGYSGPLISRVKYVGDENYALLDQIDDPDVDMTLARAYELILGSKRLSEKKDNYADALYTNMEEGDSAAEDGQEDDSSDGDTTTSTKTDKRGKRTATLEGISKPKHIPDPVKLTSFSAGFGRYGDYQLDLSTGSPVILSDGKMMGLVDITPDKNNHLNEGLHFVIQNAMEGWSFHVIAKSISKLVKKQEVSSNNED